jgi:hypothetical protein
MSDLGITEELEDGPVLTTLQGGLLLTNTLRDPAPLETALNTMIDHIESFTTAKPRRS